MNGTGSIPVITTKRIYLSVVQWIEHDTPKVKMEVQFLSERPIASVAQRKSSGLRNQSSGVRISPGVPYYFCNMS